MKFCKHCGNQIPDNAVCNCPGAVAERQSQGGYQQPVYQQQPAYTAQRPPRQGKSFGEKLIDPFKVYFKNPKKAVDNRIADKDFITPLIYIGALFMIMLGVKSCMYGAIASKQGRQFNFGLDLLAAFVAVIALCAVYVLSRFIILAVCGKKPFRGGVVMLESLISFGVNSIVPMGIILVGGLFYLAANMVGIMFFTLAAVWYIAAGLLEIKDEFDPKGNPFVRLLIVSVVIGVFCALYTLLFFGLQKMNTLEFVSFSGSSYNELRALLGY